MSQSPVYVLGINAYHAGASAALLKDGELVAACEEERFNRVKYCAGFPTQAIQWCLAEAGISALDVQHVAVSRDPRANLHKKALYVLRNRPSLRRVRDRLTNAAKVGGLLQTYATEMQVEQQAVRAELHNVEHHLAHLASAFFVSPFAHAAVLSVDGMGDFVSTMWGRGDGNRMQILGEVNYPHSLGWLYTAVTQWLGFPKYGDEGKVMGLAPYGQPTQLDCLRQVLRAHADGSYDLDMRYFALDAASASMSWAGGEPQLGTLFSEQLVALLGPPRAPGAEITAYHMDVAASLQAILEETELALLRRLQRATGETAICLAGGVAVNSVVNGKVLLETPFTDIYVQPAANDAGTSLGAAYYVWNQTLQQPRTFVMESPYTGPWYSDEELARTAREQGLTFEQLDEAALCEATAELISQGNVVGWFQGRMEWGPRALGNRSIVADPRRADMKDILNARIKHREAFRPFAPSVLLEHVGEYFEQDYPDPFMLKVYRVREDQRSVIPAVTHVDGTGRLQTVSRDVNPCYWQLIKAFQSLTGVPVILNTSFNENEPIVNTPQQAIDCFQRTRMDALVLGRCLIRK